MELCLVLLGSIEIQLHVAIFVSIVLVIALAVANIANSDVQSALTDSSVISAT